MTLATASNTWRAPPASVGAAGTASNNVAANTNTSTGTPTANDAGLPAVGTWGDHFAIMIYNKKTTAKAPMLVGGSRVTVAPVLSPSLTAGTAATTWASYSGWSHSITDYSTMASATATTLKGSDTAGTLATTGSKPSYGTEVTCDTNKWAGTSACDGITRW